MSIYEFETHTATARTASEIPQEIQVAIMSLGLEDATDLAEIHVLLSSQHGGYDIEVVHAVEYDEDDTDEDDD